MFVPFEVGQSYKRSEIHDRFGGNRQSGISPSMLSPYIFIFTGEAGHQFGYLDRWEEEGEVYLYAGDGQTGDQEFVRGNRAIRDHLRDQKQLLLFQMHGSGRPVTFVGEFFNSGHRFVQGRDRDGNARRVILFTLRRQAAQAPKPEVVEPPAAVIEMPLPELRALVLANQKEGQELEPQLARRRYYERSAAAALYVRRRAAGICEGCNEPAPFNGRDGLPYLEAHHIRRKADNGPDHPAWMVGICPNCHRRVHYGADGDSFNQDLRAVALGKEGS